MPQSTRVDRDAYDSMEVLELAGTAQEQARARESREYEGAVPGSCVAWSGDDLDVSIKRRGTSRVRVHDPFTGSIALMLEDVNVQKEPAWPVYSEHSLAIWKAPSPGEAATAGTSVALKEPPQPLRSRFVRAWSGPRLRRGVDEGQRWD